VLRRNRQHVTTTYEDVVRVGRVTRILYEDGGCCEETAPVEFSLYSVFFVRCSISILLKCCVGSYTLLTTVHTADQQRFALQEPISLVIIIKTNKLTQNSFLCGFHSIIEPNKKLSTCRKSATCKPSYIWPKCKTPCLFHTYWSYSAEFEITKNYDSGSASAWS